MSAALKPVPAALHRGEKELPFVPYQDGVMFQLLQADVTLGGAHQGATRRDHTKA